MRKLASSLLILGSLLVAKSDGQCTIGPDGRLRCAVRQLVTPNRQMVGMATMTTQCNFQAPAVACAPAAQQASASYTAIRHRERHGRRLLGRVFKGRCR